MNRSNDVESTSGRLLKQARWILAIIVALSLMPALLLWLGLGVETGMAHHTDLLEDWLLGDIDELGADFLRSKVVYTVLAGSSAGTALLTAVLGYVHFHIRREIISLLVAIATFWSGAIIAFQLMAFHDVGASLQGTSPSVFVLSNWTLAQSFTGLLMVGLPAVVLLYGNRHRWLSNRYLAFIFIACSLLAYGTIYWSSLDPIFPDMVTGQFLGIRLIELGPALLFGTAFLFLLPRVHRHCRSTFSLALWLATIPLLAAHLYMALLSEMAFDSGFTAAQLMRTGSFLIIFGGLAVDYAKVCRHEDELGRQLTVRDRRLRILLDNAVEAVAIFDRERKVRMWNRRASELLGRSRDEAIGADILPLLFGAENHDLKDQRRHFREQLQDFHACQEQQVLRSLREGLLLRPDGSTVEVEYSLVVACHDDTPVFAVLIRDISERMELQRRMTRMDRLAAVGTLAAGVVHEIKNPLTYVLSNLHLARDSADRIHRTVAPLLNGGATPIDAAARRRLQEATDDLEALLHTSNQGIDRIRRIVEDMQAFAHRRPGDLGPTSVTEALDIALRMTRAKIRHECRLHVDIRDLPPVEADETRLSQVFINLITNAIQAMAEVPERDHHLHISADTTSRGHIRVRIRDTGPGILEPVQTQIFEPFYTTKSVGQGTGLGLPVAYSIVQDHGGTLTASNRPEGGARFLLTLPGGDPS